MKKLIAGNWKMNTSRQEARDLAKGLVAQFTQSNEGFEMLLCPPSTWLGDVAREIENSAIKLGGQDCHFEDKGAFTGNISPKMLKEIDCEYVILGHSERRAQMHETNDLIKAKAEKAHQNGLVTIICVGEQESERMAGIQEDIVMKQILESVPESSNAKNTVIAYEPVWAIGTGKTATLDDIRNMHQFIHNVVSKKLDGGNHIRILYGGSVKPNNAKDIMTITHVGGVLVGGASLKVDDFSGIANAS